MWRGSEALSPIECEQVLQEIELYLDGELVGAIARDIEDHLGQCGPCMSRSEFRRKLKGLIAARCGCDEVPPHLTEKLHTLLSRVDPTEP